MKWLFMMTIGLCGLIPCLQAAQVALQPTHFELNAKNKIATLLLQNQDEQDITIQIDPLSWTQNNGQDILRNTDDIIVSPRLITIAPHQKQVVRLALNTMPIDQTTEKSYRLLLRQVPIKAKTTAPAAGEMLHLELNMLLPIFVVPAHTVTLPPLWTVKRLNDHRAQVTVQNRQNQHIVINRLQLVNGAKVAVGPAQTGMHYVLANESATWTLPLTQTTDAPIYVQATIQTPPT